MQVRLINAGAEFDTEEEVRVIFERLANDGGIIVNPVGPRPWSRCAADVIDKYGVGWFISTPMDASRACPRAKLRAAIYA